MKLKCSKLIQDGPRWFRMVRGGSQIILDGPRCSQMFLDVPRCSQMFLDITRCSQMSLDVPRCFQMFLDVPRYAQMILDDPRCSQMFQNVSRCSQMCPDVPRCYQMFLDDPNISRCSLWSSATSISDGIFVVPQDSLSQAGSTTLEGIIFRCASISCTDDCHMLTDSLKLEIANF